MHTPNDPIDPFLPIDPDAALSTARQLADGVAATLRVARALAYSRRAIDLTGFDRMIGLLCARALDLPPEQGRLIRPRLITLLGDLDGLSASIQPPS